MSSSIFASLKKRPVAPALLYPNCLPFFLRLDLFIFARSVEFVAWSVSDPPSSFLGGGGRLPVGSEKSCFFLGLVFGGGKLTGGYRGGLLLVRR